MSQKQLAKKFYVDQTTIRDWETRGTEPNFKILVALAEFFGVTADYLLGKD